MPYIFSLLQISFLPNYIKFTDIGRKLFFKIMQFIYYRLIIFFKNSLDDFLISN